MNLALITGFIMTANLFTMMGADEPKRVEGEPQKKEQKVKVFVKKDGKEIKIDTTFSFNLPDEKAIQAKVDSMLKAEGVENFHGKGKHVMIMKSRKHEGKPENEDYTIFIQEGDSGLTKGKKVVRVFAGGNGETIDLEGFPVPPPPPMPPLHVKGFKIHGGDPFAFDPNDDDIVTYDRKDIGKGLEKIIIVRKKRDANAPVKVVEGVKIEKEEISK